ncbi:MAG: hypothetical protein DRI77_02320 [Chloroflexi bacterium]|nr:MAG: hypothetical protein DRI77_02320 [Chloroflexota bacterium]
MKKGYLIILIALSILTLLSLALNGAVILTLLQARQIGLGAVTETRSTIAELEDMTFSYTLAVDQEIPIAVSIPFDEQVTVPINTSIPIDTTVTVPINAGLLGTFDVDVPIRTIVPIDLNVSVPISKTVDIATTVPLAVDVPIEIPIADTPLVGYLDKLDAALGRIEARLENPFGNRN